MNTKANPSDEATESAVAASFIVYDERGIHDPGEAAVLVSCGSLREAWRYLRRTFGNGCIYEYNMTPARELVNESLVGWRVGGQEWHA